MSIRERMAANRRAWHEDELASQREFAARLKAEAAAGAAIIAAKRLAEAEAARVAYEEACQRQQAAINATMDGLRKEHWTPAPRLASLTDAERKAAIERSRMSKRRSRFRKNLTRAQGHALMVYQLQEIAAAGYQAFYEATGTAVEPWLEAPEWRRHLWVEIAKIARLRGSVATCWDIWRGNKPGDTPAWKGMNAEQRKPFDTAIAAMWRVQERVTDLAAEEAWIADMSRGTQ